ncbi:hypothetical protein CAFE_03060 [Caprobacter fermentans]|uniref:Uncharacterized protein n=1 Tax=Caproicibacter fermentans TaxID=2576756 RepID=A0A6N8HV29_9FIRM|nr:hypothetical protein [Caproicibacter fermentans]MVB09644.1 hypothetical protein [Caproicibacter fermentans]
MSKEDIIEMVVRELTEKALEDRRENLSEEEQQPYAEVGKLSERARDITAKLPKDEQQTLEDYFVKTNLIADKECAFLYVQGAKDCVELLKKLGAL